MRCVRAFWVLFLPELLFLTLIWSDVQSSFRFWQHICVFFFCNTTISVIFFALREGSV